MEAASCLLPVGVTCIRVAERRTEDRRGSGKVVRSDHGRTKLASFHFDQVFQPFHPNVAGVEGVLGPCSE